MASHAGFVRKLLTSLLAVTALTKEKPRYPVRVGAGFLGKRRRWIGCESSRVPSVACHAGALATVVLSYRGRPLSRFLRGVAFPPHLVPLVRSHIHNRDLPHNLLIVSAVMGLALVVLVQDKWTSLDSWFVAVFASAVMAMVIGQYVNQID